MSLYLLSLHSDMRRHVVLNSSTRQAGVAPQVLGVVEVLQGIPGQGVSCLPVQRLPLLDWVEERTRLGLGRVGGQICWHVVFGEGEARSGDSVGAGAAETRQRSGAGCVFVGVVRSEHFDAVPVVEPLKREVDAWGPRTTAHDARHGKLGVVG